MPYVDNGHGGLTWKQDANDRMVEDMADRVRKGQPLPDIQVPLPKTVVRPPQQPVFVAPQTPNSELNAAFNIHPAAIEAIINYIASQRQKQAMDAWSRGTGNHGAHTDSAYTSYAGPHQGRVFDDKFWQALAASDVLNSAVISVIPRQFNF